YSMVIFFPSIQPSLRISCQNASERTVLPEAVLLARKPMRGIFPVCCASADAQSARSIAQSVRRMTVFLIGFLRVCCSLLFDHLIRPVQHRLRNGDRSAS